MSQLIDKGHQWTVRGRVGPSLVRPSDGYGR